MKQFKCHEFMNQNLNSFQQKKKLTSSFSIFDASLQWILTYHNDR